MMKNTNLTPNIKNYIADNNIVMEDTFGSNNIVDVNLNDDQLLELLNTNYSESYNRAKKGYLLYRGDSFDSHILIRKPGTRVSKNNSLNYYNRLLSGILPSWSEYPYRNKSFICTSSFNYANKWNDKTSIVLPRNDTKLGICPTNDMWKSFNKSGISRLIYFNLDLDYFFIYVMKKDSSYTNSLFINENKDCVIDFLNKVSTKIKSLSDKEINKIITKIENKFYNVNLFKTLLLDIKNTDLGFIEILDNILNPIDNNFKIEKISKYNINSKDCREIWFSDNAIFLDIKYLFENKNSKIYKDLFK